ncbi:MAG: hypothetical protein V1800_02840 [Candidatus Latescibacterota bacterium]
MTLGPILTGRLAGWDGPLTWGKWCGLGLAILALALITLQRNNGAVIENSRWKWALFAFLAFFLNAINTSGQKMLSGLGLGTEVLTFNLAYFVCGAAVGLTLSFVPRGNQGTPRIGRSEWVLGLGGGLLVVVQMFALLYAVARLHAAIAYATLTILSLTIMTLGGWLIFGENLEPREKIGLVVACVALLLINL